MLPPVPDHPRASVVIRTYNEGRHLPGVLNRLAKQRCRSFEVIIVDSGSTDSTVAIAELAGARIVHIRKSDFTFGRSLNVGCAAARGEILVFISGHCYPRNERWLEEMLSPFDTDEKIGLVYGSQRGGRLTKFSEHRHFAKTFPSRSAIPQEGFFCNNANCAIRRSLWQQRPYNEALTGLEDLEWARWATDHGWKAAYTAAGGVYHIHEETWQQVRRRYEREAIALKHIIPDFHFSLWDFLRLFPHSVILDWRQALRRGVWIRKAREVLLFRLMQYWGTWHGARAHRVITRQIKEKFFYPNK